MTIPGTYMRSYDDMPKLILPEINISDTTLRGGAKMPGITMTGKQQLRIFDYLHQIGVDKTELFMHDDFHRGLALEMLAKGYDKPDVTGWARSNRKDIDGVRVVDGVNETGILMPVSDLQIYDRLNLTREEAKTMYLDAFEYALDKGLKARAHLEDITRADMGFVLPFVEELLKKDPDVMIRVCDTVGFGLPFPEEMLKYQGDSPAFSIPGIVAKLKMTGVKNIQMHMHDDYGLAVANTISGLLYGANWANGSILGIGERAGIAELEKILAFANTRAGTDKYNVHPLTAFANYMEEEGIAHVPGNKAVVGKNVFAMPDGDYDDAVQKNPFTYHPFPPRNVGNNRKVLLGPEIDNDTVAREINLLVVGKSPLPIEKNDPRVTKIRKAIASRFKNGRDSPISLDELEGLITKYF